MTSWSGNRHWWVVQNQDRHQAKAPGRGGRQPNIPLRRHGEWPAGGLLLAGCLAATIAGSQVPSSGATHKETGRLDAVLSMSTGPLAAVAGLPPGQCAGTANCYRETLKVTGDKTLTMLSYSTLVGQFIYKGTCGGWMGKFAAQNGGQVQLPGIISANANVHFSAVLENWKGPGVYKLSTTGKGPYVSAASFIFNSISYVDNAYGVRHPATVVASIAKNGSFSISFTRL